MAANRKKNMEKSIRILGIDPGTAVTGYGLVETGGRKPVILTLGVLRPGKFDDHYQRLKYLHAAASSPTTFPPNGAFAA